MPKLNQNITLTCSAAGKPSVTKYRFYVNDTSIGNSTSGSLTVNANDCTRYNGNYKCVPESTIGDGEVKSQSVVVTGLYIRNWLYAAFLHISNKAAFLLHSFFFQQILFLFK